MKKKIMIVVCILVFSFSSLQVYASSVLDSDVISMIQEIIKGKSASDELAQTKEEINNELINHVNTEIDGAKQQLESYQSSKLDVATKDLNAYIEDIKSKISENISLELKDEKLKLDQDFDKEIDKIKSDLNNQLKNILKDKNK